MLVCAIFSFSLSFVGLRQLREETEVLLTQCIYKTYVSTLTPLTLQSDFCFEREKKIAESGAKASIAAQKRGLIAKLIAIHCSPLRSALSFPFGNLPLRHDRCFSHQINKYIAQPITRDGLRRMRARHAVCLQTDLLRT